MTDGTTSLKGRKFTKLKISHLNHFCASLAPAIHPVLTPTTDLRLTPLSEQAYLCFNISFLSGLQEEIRSAQPMFLTDRRLRLFYMQHNHRFIQL